MFNRCIIFQFKSFFKSSNHFIKRTFESIQDNLQVVFRDKNLQGQIRSVDILKLSVFVDIVNLIELIVIKQVVVVLISKIVFSKIFKYLSRVKVYSRELLPLNAVIININGITNIRTYPYSRFNFMRFGDKRNSEFIKASILSIFDSAFRADLKSSKFRFMSAASFQKSEIKLSPKLSELKEFALTSLLLSTPPPPAFPNTLSTVSPGSPMNSERIQVLIYSSSSISSRYCAIATAFSLFTSDKK